MSIPTYTHEIDRLNNQLICRYGVNRTADQYNDGVVPVPPPIDRLEHKDPMPPLGVHPDHYDGLIYCSYPHSNFAKDSEGINKQD